MTDNNRVATVEPDHEQDDDRRLYTVGVPQLIWLPYDDRRTTTFKAARQRLEDYKAQHPDHVAAVVRRIVCREPVHVFHPGGERPPQTDRVHLRLRKLVRDAHELDLVIATAGWRVAPLRYMSLFAGFVVTELRTSRRPK